MSSGPTKPHRERGVRRIDLALPSDEAEALDARCESTGETKTAVIRLALRRELGLLAEENEQKMTSEQICKLVQQGLSIGASAPACQGTEVGPNHIRVDVLDPMPERHIDGVSAWLTDRIPSDMTVDVTRNGYVTRVHRGRWKVVARG